MNCLQSSSNFPEEIEDIEAISGDDRVPEVENSICKVLFTSLLQMHLTAIV